MLHWTRNDGALEPGELLLLDAGVEGDSLYTADITRTLPISGRFSRRAARDLRARLGGAARRHRGRSKPGNDFMEPNRARDAGARRKGSSDLGILEVSLEEALDPRQAQFYKRYSLHNVSHMLGLDVHDCAQAREQEYKFGKLRAGMVLTVEPGLYFQPDDATVPERYRGIGVRIEDDVAVTDAGPRISRRACRRAPATSSAGSPISGRLTRYYVGMTDEPGGGGGGGIVGANAVTVRRGELVLDRPAPEREDDHADERADAGNEVEQRERAVVSGLGEDAPVDPDRRTRSSR